MTDVINQTQAAVIQQRQVVGGEQRSVWSSLPFTIAVQQQDMAAVAAGQVDFVQGHDGAFVVFADLAVNHAENGDLVGRIEMIGGSVPEPDQQVLERQESACAHASAPVAAQRPR